MRCASVLDGENGDDGNGNSDGDIDGDGVVANHHQVQNTKIRTNSRKSTCASASMHTMLLLLPTLFNKVLIISKRVLNRF